MARPPTPVDLEQFQRTIRELGLIRAGELERFVAAAPGRGSGAGQGAGARRQVDALSGRGIVAGQGAGLVVGNYFILDKVGAGGMGVVFKAKHRRLHRVVALEDPAAIAGTRYQPVLAVPPRGQSRRPAVAIPTSSRCSMPMRTAAFRS